MSEKPSVSGEPDPSSASLVEAAYYGYSARVAELLASGTVDVDQRDEDGCTPFSSRLLKDSSTSRKRCCRRARMWWRWIVWGGVVWHFDYTYARQARLSLVPLSIWYACLERKVGPSLAPFRARW